MIRETALPETMQVIEITAPGGPEVLLPATRALPSPGTGEVLIRVAAAGVNRPDAMQRAGLYPPPAGASDIPGLEIAGTIVAVGPDVQTPGLGDSVCALVTGGGYAEYCSAAAVLCLPFPQGFTALQSAALPETFFTVWSNVFDRGRLVAGERLLVHGGSSGIGTTAIQLAKAFGATVYCTAGTAEKCAACETLGADRAINYKSEDFVERIGELTKGRGVDLILDMVMGDYLKRDLKCLAPDGRLVFIAVQGGPKIDSLNVLPIMLKRLTISGSTLRPRSLDDKADIAQSLAREVWPLLAQDLIAPVIHSSFALHEAAQAHRLLESSRHIGKIMLNVNST